MGVPISFRVPRVSRIDILLALMVFVWAANYSLVKQAFRDISPMPFNAARFTLASMAFFIGLVVVRRRARRSAAVNPLFYTEALPTARDWRTFLWLGLAGHCGYHLCWANGLAITTASNSALIMGASPVVVSTVAAALGHERIRPLHWVGITVSLAGVVLVVGRGASLSGPTFWGDVLTLGAVGCWTLLTLGGSRLMTRHSPLYVSAVTTAIGTVAYVVLAAPTLGTVGWTTLGPGVWAVIVFSGLLSVAAASVIWYAAVQKIGAARASVYSNIVPMVAMLLAAFWLSEPVTTVKMIGAGLVLCGVVLTRLARPAPAAPLEE